MHNPDTEEATYVTRKLDKNSSGFLFHDSSIYPLHESDEMSAVFACVKRSCTEDSCLRTCTWCFCRKNNVDLQCL